MCRFVTNLFTAGVIAIVRKRWNDDLDVDRMRQLLWIDIGDVTIRRLLSRLEDVPPVEVVAC